MGRRQEETQNTHKGQTVCRYRKRRPSIDTKCGEETKPYCHLDLELLASRIEGKYVSAVKSYLVC